MVSESDVVAAYRLILGREPESPEAVASCAQRYNDVKELRDAFFRSPELVSSPDIGGYIYLACVPARYSQNIKLYQRSGGLVEAVDARGFSARSPGGDSTRYYSLCMAIDLIIKEDIVGDFAELGVYQGATASLFAALARKCGRSVYLLDTFEGFSEQDLVGIDGHKRVEFSDTSLENVAEFIGPGGVRFVKGFFPDTACQIPSELCFSLVHIDCDLYAPFKSALEFFWERLSPGGFMVMHDYASFYWDGAEKAVDQFFANKQENVILIPDTSGTAIVRKNSVVI